MATNGAPRRGSQLPACRSTDPGHRAQTCPRCQERYALRRSGAPYFPRRRYRLRTRSRKPAPCGSTDPRHRRRNCVNCRGTARCGSTLPEHRARTCRRCRAIANAEDYARNARSRAQAKNQAPRATRAEEGQTRRLRARIRAKLRRARAPKICAECGNAAQRLMIQSESAYAYACLRHAGLVMRSLLEARADEPTAAPRSQPLPNLTFEEALAWLATQKATVADRIREAAARNPWGVTLATDSPLYRQRIRALVAQARH